MMHLGAKRILFLALFYVPSSAQGDDSLQSHGEHRNLQDLWCVSILTECHIFLRWLMLTLRPHNHLQY